MPYCTKRVTYLSKAQPFTPFRASPSRTHDVASRFHEVRTTAGLAVDGT